MVLLTEKLPKDQYKYVVRAKGYLYEDGEEKILDCYAAKGGLSEHRRDALTFTSEAEAWDYASLSGLMYLRNKDGDVRVEKHLPCVICGKISCPHLDVN